jgi:uncharacterized membrane protein YhaH (DUF805 family)
MPLILPTILFWFVDESLLSQAVQILLSLFYLGALVLLFWKPADGNNRYGPDPRLDPNEAMLASE